VNHQGIPVANSVIMWFQSILTRSPRPRIPPWEELYSCDQVNGLLWTWQYASGKIHCLVPLCPTCLSVASFLNSTSGPQRCQLVCTQCGPCLNKIDGSSADVQSRVSTELYQRIRTGWWKAEINARLDGDSLY